MRRCASRGEVRQGVPVLPLRVSIGTLAEGRFLEVNDAFLRDHGFTRTVIGRTSPSSGYGPTRRIAGG